MAYTNEVGEFCGSIPGRSSCICCVINGILPIKARSAQCAPGLIGGCSYKPALHAGDKRRILGAAPLTEMCRCRPCNRKTGHNARTCRKRGYIILQLDDIQQDLVKRQASSQRLEVHLRKFQILCGDPIRSASMNEQEDAILAKVNFTHLLGDSDVDPMHVEALPGAVAASANKLF